MQGIACFVEEATVEDQEGDKNRNFEVVTAVRDAIRNAFLDWSPRLLMAMYSCDIQASSTSCHSQYKRKIANIQQPRFLVKSMR